MKCRGEECRLFIRHKDDCASGLRDGDMDCNIEAHIKKLEGELRVYKELVTELKDM